jgi:hypothetical protein
MTGITIEGDGTGGGITIESSGSEPGGTAIFSWGGPRTADKGDIELEAGG